MRWRTATPFPPSRRDEGSTMRCITYDTSRDGPPRWRVRLKRAGKMHQIGRYATITEARAARDAAVGELAHLNGGEHKQETST